MAKDSCRNPNCHLMSNLKDGQATLCRQCQEDMVRRLTRGMYEQDPAEYGIQDMRAVAKNTLANSLSKKDGR